MAKLHHLEWETRGECLEAFASSFGDYPPRGDVPSWWDAFERWYLEQKEKAKDGVVSMTLRTEAVEYDDDYADDEDEDDPDDGEGEPEDPSEETE
jgi:hypothetical protein